MGSCFSDDALDTSKVSNTEPKHDLVTNINQHLENTRDNTQENPKEKELLINTQVTCTSKSNIIQNISSSSNSKTNKLNLSKLVSNPAAILCEQESGDTKEPDDDDDFDFNDPVFQSDYAISLKISNNLAKYYSSCNNNTFYSSDKRGLFLSFVIDNGFDDSDIYDEVMNTEYDDCMLVTFDSLFPFKKTINDENKRFKAIQKIFQYIYENDSIPPDDFLTAKPTKKWKSDHGIDGFFDKSTSSLAYNADDKQFLNQTNLSYNSWYSVKMDKSFTQSAPKKIDIVIDDDNDNSKTNKIISTLPPVLSTGTTEQHLLIFGYFRILTALLNFLWIIPVDIIDLCYKYLPTPNINIIVIAGSKLNYMEYHWLTSQHNQSDYKHKTIHKYNKYNSLNNIIHKKLEFKIYNDGGKNIRILNEHFDTVSSGICFTDNIKFPQIIYNKYKLNQLINYSAILKCGGEVVDDEYNWCTNYCSAIVFDKNQLMLHNTDDHNDGDDGKEKQIVIKKKKEKGMFDTDSEPEDDEKKTDPDIANVFGRGLGVGLNANNPNGNHFLPQYVNNNVITPKKKHIDCKEIKCFELKLPKMPIKCQYKSIWNNIHGLISMGFDKKRNETSVYQLAFNNDICNQYWIKLDKLQYNHLYGNLCMINTHEYNGDNNLIICGGNNSNKIELYNFNNSKWISLKNICYNNTKYIGINYNFLYNNIIIGGGSGSNSKLCASYDIIKDEWFKLPNTKYKHRHYPSIFNNIDNPEIVYIYGDNQKNLGKMEYIDLRSNNKKWNLVDKNKTKFIQSISPSQVRNIVI